MIETGLSPPDFYSGIKDNLLQIPLRLFVSESATVLSFINKNILMHHLLSVGVLAAELFQCPHKISFKITRFSSF
jgi:predicted membrane chloride channel (bestrophin family)